MNTEQWHQANDRFMADAVKWIRLLLKKQITRLAAPAPPSEDVPEEKNPWWKRSRGSIGKRLALPPPDADIQSAIVQTASSMAAAESADPLPAVTILCQRLGLTPFEKAILLLCAAMELDTRVPDLCARAQDDAQHCFPTFSLALTMFETPSWDALAPQGPLRYWLLIHVSRGEAQPLTAAYLRLDERIVNFLKGMNHPDERLSSYIAPVEAHVDELPFSQKQMTTDICRHLQRPGEGGRPPVVQLVGPHVGSKEIVAAKAAASLGLLLYRLTLALLPNHPADLENLIRLWQRETILLPVILYIDTENGENNGQSEGLAARLGRFIERAMSACIVGCREAWSALGPTAVSMVIEKPTPAEQQSLWRQFLPDADDIHPAALSSQFNLDVPTIRYVAGRSAQEGNGNQMPALWQACLRRCRPRMDNLAQHIDIKATWDDIVLPQSEMALLRQIADQVRYRYKVYDQWGFRAKMNRGLGITALFTGESGTGKTMAAEVIASHLDLYLYRIDLSAVVSKYIGETEKNLRSLFDAAEDGGAILFFDEADALFGKRSEVKDSHDRYANIEINYLLQRMEAYRGLAILATNMKTAMDPAFIRRLRFIVNFAFPESNLRKTIWQKVFPEALPKAAIDYDRLAKLSLAGGAIHSIAVNAAFLAAQNDSNVDMVLILDAARKEYRKMGRPISEADFK